MIKMDQKILTAHNPNTWKMAKYSIDSFLFPDSADSVVRPNHLKFGLNLALIFDTKWRFFMLLFVRGNFQRER